MIRINTESNGYNIAADILATIIGAGAGMIVGVISEASIQCAQSSSIKTSVMKLGKLGLETVTLYKVSPKMRDEIDDLVEVYNTFADAMNTYEEHKTPVEVASEVEE